MKKKIAFTGLAFLLMLICYFNSKFYLEDKNWKYAQGFNAGYSIGDVDFSNENYHICFWEYLWIINSEFEIVHYAEKKISSN